MIANNKKHSSVFHKLKLKANAQTRFSDELISDFETEKRGAKFHLLYKIIILTTAATMQPLI